MPLEITHRELAPDVAVVALAGKMMMGTVGDRVASLTDELLRTGKRIIVFDLAGITALDSTGVGQFISSFNRIMASGGEMRMAGASGHVLQTFRVSLLDQVFSFYPTAEEAARV
jgi:anti-sigma B factor antagonist